MSYPSPAGAGWRFKVPRLSHHSGAAFYRRLWQSIGLTGASAILPTLLLWLLILTFALFFGRLALAQHAAFQTNGLDLGNVDQALWNTAQGDFLRFSLMAPLQSRLALHVEPILLIFVPFYWLGLGGPALLLVSQAVIVAVGAWPLYQLSIGNYQLSIGNYQLSIGNDQLATIEPFPRPPLAFRLAFLALPLAYLLLPTLQSAVLFDFHAVTLAPTFFLFAFLALARGRTRSGLIFLLLAMACKEDMPLVTAMVGLYAGLVWRRWPLAGGIIALSALWFVTAFFVIQPRFALGGNVQLDRYAWLGENPLAMGRTALTQPGLLLTHLWQQADLPGYLSWLLFPTAFLALLSPLTLLPLLPALAVNLLSDNPFTWRLEDFHYGAPLAPFVFISAAYGINNLTRWLQRRGGPAVPAKRLTPLLLGLLLTFSLVYHHFRGYTPLAQAFSWPEVTGHHRQLADLLATIPPRASLFTQSNLAPHLTQRPVIYTDFAYFTDPAFAAPAPVEAIVLDVTTFENIGGLHQFLRQTLLDSGEYTLITAQEGLIYLEPAPAGSRPGPAILPPAFYTFAQPAGPPLYPLRLDFADQLRLHGYSLHFNRQEEVQVSLDVEALQPLAGLQPVLYLLDERGEPLGATVDRQPDLVWLPPEQWPPGQVIRLHFNTLPWHTRSRPAYRLALGFSSGADPWDLSRRLPPQLDQPGGLALRFLAEGSLVELARIEQHWGLPGGGPLPRQFSPPWLPHAVGAIFEKQIELVSYAPARLDRSVDPARLSLTLAWRALSRPPPLVRFVHLVGPEGRLSGQSDSAPDRGHYPTVLWQAGEVVVETVEFPVTAALPQGDYTLHLGFYRPDTGSRLRLPAGADHLELTVRLP